MDVKSKINFINSVGSGKKVPCPKCNTLNETDARFCITCGLPLGQAAAAAGESPAPAADVIICQGCKAPNEPDARFCISCGKSLGQAAAPMPSPKEKPDQIPKNTSFVPVKKAALKREEDVAEESGIFAEGMPEWDILPPQVMVRRKRR